MTPEEFASAKIEPFTLQQDNIWAVPVLHYRMEMAAQVRLAFNAIRPTCVAVELAETMQLQLLHAASRLPDISVVVTDSPAGSPLYYLCEPCDPAFEGLRSALEAQIPAWCIDLDVNDYPNFNDAIPDPYAVQRIGLKNYYEAFQKFVFFKSPEDHKRELYMAKRLKELSLSYDRVLFIGGMAHMQNVLEAVKRSSFPEFEHAKRETVEVCALAELSRRDVMAECGWISMHYEMMRNEENKMHESAEIFFPPDRQKLIYTLFKKASESYIKNTGHPFPGYHMRNLMKFLRNYAFIQNKLMPDLYQILTAAKSCVDHNFAYEVWEIATQYPFQRNVDSLMELDLTIEEVWGQSKLIQFHLKRKNPKSNFGQRQRKDRLKARFNPPGPFSICSYPPEDVTIERFGEFLKKKGSQIILEEGARTLPFTTSLEDGIDTRETIRHWHEKKLYVKTKGKPSGGVGSVVVIFSEDSNEEERQVVEQYPWKTTWMGEHSQESDMAFYATPLSANVVGPGISRCEYGGFMMSYPPRRMLDVWSDPDYETCRTKAEILLMAAIDYAVQPLITYVASKPPRTSLKSYANRFGKKVVYLPIAQLSPITLNKLRVFHVLDSHDKRNIAGEYIF